MNAAQLAEIKERAEKATPGPWEWGEGYEQKDPGYYVASKSNGHIVFADEDIAVRSEDVDFLLHAREDIPALVAEVERLQKEVKAMYHAGYTEGKRHGRIIWEGR